MCIYTYIYILCIYFQLIIQQFFFPVYDRWFGAFFCGAIFPTGPLTCLVLTAFYSGQCWSYGSSHRAHHVGYTVCGFWSAGEQMQEVMVAWDGSQKEYLPESTSRNQEKRNQIGPSLKQMLVKGTPNPTIIHSRLYMFLWFWTDDFCWNSVAPKSRDTNQNPHEKWWICDNTRSRSKAFFP